MSSFQTKNCQNNELFTISKFQGSDYDNVLLGLRKAEPIVLHNLHNAHFYCFLIQPRSQCNTYILISNLQTLLPFLVVVVDIVKPCLAFLLHYLMLYHNERGYIALQNLLPIKLRKSDRTCHTGQNVLLLQKMETAQN